MGRNEAEGSGGQGPLAPPEERLLSELGVEAMAGRLHVVRCYLRNARVGGLEEAIGLAVRGGCSGCADDILLYKARIELYAHTHAPSGPPVLADELGALKAEARTLLQTFDAESQEKLTRAYPRLFSGEARAASAPFNPREKP